MREELTNYVVIDSKTGEYIQNLTQKEVKILNDRYTTTDVPTKLNDKKIPNKDELKDFIKENLGGFYFNYYTKLEANQYTFRFLYICTYENFKGYLEFGNAQAEGRLCKKKICLKF